MKKLTIIICSLICIFTSTLFVGCSDKNAINMGVYFNSEVNASVYKTSTTSQKLALSTLTGNNPYEADKYLQYVLTSNKDYFYGMYVEKITFYIYSTAEQEVEFDITLTGTQNGKENNYSSTLDFILTQQPCALKAYSSVKITVEVNDKITLSSADSKLTIKLSDPVDVKDNDFKYCIYNLQVYGYHKS